MLKGRFFKLFGYTQSHRMLFIRSELQLPDLEYNVKYEPNCTVDLEFVGVTELQLVPSFTLLDICLLYTSDAADD